MGGREGAGSPQRPPAWTAAVFASQPGADPVTPVLVLSAGAAAAGVTISGAPCAPLSFITRVTDPQMQARPPLMLCSQVLAQLCSLP